MYVPRAAGFVTRSPERRSASGGRDSGVPLRAAARGTHTTPPPVAAVSVPLQIMTGYLARETARRLGVSFPDGFRQSRSELPVELPQLVQGLEPLVAIRV